MGERTSNVKGFCLWGGEQWHRERDRTQPALNSFFDPIDGRTDTKARTASFVVDAPALQQLRLAGWLGFEKTVNGFDVTHSGEEETREMTAKSRRRCGWYTSVEAVDEGEGHQKKAEAASGCEARERAIDAASGSSNVCLCILFISVHDQFWNRIG